jgi:hypothetical protein
MIALSSITKYEFLKKQHSELFDDFGKIWDISFIFFIYSLEANYLGKPKAYIQILTKHEFS